MCPRWGLIRYDRHKAMPGSARAMALELGSAAHDGFAAIRFCELLEYGPRFYGERWQITPVLAHGAKQFGASRFAEMCSIFDSKEDYRQRTLGAAYHAINTSGFYDDPSDRRRTLTNLETSLVAYYDRIEHGRYIPYVKDDFVGIEVVFDITIKFLVPVPKRLQRATELRYIGKMDGLCYDTINNNKIEPHENKTASRLDKAWHDGMSMSHQVTGYTVAAACLTGTEVDSAVVLGLMVPLPKTYDLGGVAHHPVDRDQWRKREFFRWVHTTYQIWQQYKDDPLNAPEYTHSCNRYFRSCSFIPLCAMASPEERQLSYDSMVTDEWSPLHERAES